MKKQILSLVIVLLVGLFSYTTLFQKGFYYTHDDIQVRRVQEIRKEIKYLNFPIRWISGLSHGYGYPLFNFYSPLPYYIGGFATVIKGVDAVVAVKITIILGFILSSLFMYLLGKELYGNIGGITSALLYLYAPFHSVEIYVRGSLTEFWAFVPLPLLYYSVLKLYRDGKIKYLVYSAFSLSVLMLSHHVVAILFAPVFILFLIFLNSTKIGNKQNLKKVSLSICLGLGLSSFFWIPSFVESSLVRAPILESLIFQSYKIYFLPLIKLINMPWGYGGFSLKDSGAMSFEIGKVHLFLMLLSAVAIFKNRKSWVSKIIAFCFLGFFISVFMVTPYSQKIWETVPYFIYTHFPWRYLAVTAFFASLIGGYSLNLFKSTKLKIIFSIIIISALLITEGYKFKPKEMLQNYTPSVYDLQDTTTWEYQYLPIWLSKPIENTFTQKVEVLTGKAEIKIISPRPDDYRFRAVAEGYSRLRFNTYYFPGWNLYVDGKLETIDFHNENNLITFIITPGVHDIRLRFEDTPIRRTGNIISVLSLACITIVFIKVKRHEKTY